MGQVRLITGARTHRLTGIVLPAEDVRTRLNERAIREWAESWRRFIRYVVLFLVDSLAGVLSVWIVQLTWALVSRGGRRPLPDPVPLLAMVFCLQPLALRATGAYGGGRARTDLARLALGIAIAASLGWLQARLFGRVSPDLPNKTAYVYTAVVVCGLAWTLRLVLDRVIASSYRAHVMRRRVLLVGARADAEQFVSRSQERGGSELQALGLLRPTGLDKIASELEEGMANHEALPLLGSVEEVESALSQTRAHGVIVVSGMPLARLESLVAACFKAGASVSVLPQTLTKLSGASLDIRHSSVGTLLQLRPLRLAVPQLALKRTLDLTLTAVALLLLLPVLVAVGTAVKLSSPGSILFRQTRVGVGGRRFEILKFRTMVEGAHEQKETLRHLNEYADERLFKIKNDPRVTPLGRFLRKTSLDELPQLWNVIRGDMSLVGPRPCLPEEFERYAPHHLERLFVIPGVTGPWQVSGRNDIVDFEHVVALDRDYVHQWTLATDISILARTIPTLLRRGGAY